MIEAVKEVENIINESLLLVHSKRRMVAYDNGANISNCLLLDFDVVGNNAGRRVLEVAYIDYWLIIRKVRVYNTKALCRFLGRVNRAFNLNDLNSLTEIGDLIKSIYKDSTKTLVSKWAFV